MNGRAGTLNVSISLSHEGARQALRALADVLDFMAQPSTLEDYPLFVPRAVGPVRLLALLLERALDEADQLAPQWPSSSGSIHKIKPGKIQG